MLTFGKAICTEEEYKTEKNKENEG